MTTRVFSLIAAACLGLMGWQATVATPPARLQADPNNPLDDSDGDFLPDCVEWALLTNYQQPDTDNDGAGDFVEVVQHGAPRTPSDALPADHELRVVVTAHQTPNGAETWLHVLCRLMGDPSLMTSFDLWAQIAPMPTERLPLSLLSASPINLTQRDVPGQGRWYVASCPLVSTTYLQTVLPCTLAVDAQVGGRQVRTGVKLFDLQGTIASLVPYGDDLFAVQRISAAVATPTSTANRVCVMRLAEVGSGPAGTAYQVVDADCRDCTDLECVGTACAGTVNWIFQIPGGAETITGGGN